MPTYSRETWIPAPLDVVWEFHSTVEGLLRLTPGWMRLRVEAVKLPDAADGTEEIDENPETAVLVAGTQIRMSVRPFGIGPRRRWTSRIVERKRGEGSAYFVDDMSDGPFRSWEHTHAFFADGDGTLLRDTVRYRLPFGLVGDAIGPLATVGFEPMFRDRHARTRELLGAGRNRGDANEAFE